MYAEAEAALLLAEGLSPAELESAVWRRERGEPLEQILGWADFDGLRIRLLPGVFVPRQRSVSMVQAAARLAKPGALAVDVGCGSGALGAALAARRPDLVVWGIDYDPDAVACARLNLPPDRVLLGDLLDPLPAGAGFGLGAILANLPYVPTAAIALMPSEARDHEHRVALDGGPDGLDQHRRLLAQAPPRLAPGGLIVTECGQDQVDTLSELMGSAGLQVEVNTDCASECAVLVGTAPN